MQPKIYFESQKGCDVKQQTMVQITIEKEKRIISVRNVRGVKVKKCCASCAFKDYDAEGERICKMWGGVEVGAKDRCKLWQMSDGMKNAGRFKGVVRDIVTKEIVIG